MRKGRAEAVTRALRRMAAGLLAAAVLLCWTTAARAAADLLLTITDDQDPVVSGATVTYQIGVFNDNEVPDPATATGVSALITLPAGVAWVSDDRSCDTSSLGPDGTGTITCYLPDLPPGSFIGVNLVTTVTMPSGQPGQEVVTVVGVASSPDDTNIANNEGRQSTTVGDGPADLRLTLYGPDPDSAPLQSELTYALLVENLGAGIGDGVTLTADIFGNGLMSVLAINPDVFGNRFGAECTPGAPSGPDSFHRITCTLPGLMERLGAEAKSGRWLVEIRVLANGPTAVRLDGAVAAATADPDALNNTASQSNRVAEVADLSLSLAPSLSPVAPGQEFSYTLVATNAGPSRAENVLLYVELPAGFVVREILNDGLGNCIPGARYECGLGDLMPGEVRTLSIRGLVRRAVETDSHTCGATVTSDAFDHEISDNYVTVSTPVRIGNLLANPSFETDPRAGSDWVVADDDATEAWDCTKAADGTCSMRFSAGTGGKKELRADVELNGLKGDTLELSGWNRASKVPSTGKVQLQMKIWYNNGTTVTRTAAFAVGSHDWQSRSLSYVATRNYYQVRYLLNFTATSGKAWFDQASLVVRPQ